MKYLVFICYRREGGSALAILLKDRLASAGYTTFLDLTSLGSGQFKEALMQRVHDSLNVLVILSPHALDRCGEEGDIMAAEIECALKEKKNVIPVMVDDFEWPAEDSLPSEMQDLPKYNGVNVSFEFFDSVMSNLMRRLKSPDQMQGNDKEEDNKFKILLWGDFDISYLDKIKNRLGLDESYDIDILSDPLEILSENLNEISVIILIVADCTKFSSNPTAVENVGIALSKFVSDGGKLICAHDVIYRRTRNDKLQEVFGCKITNFKAADGVEYKKTQKCIEKGVFSSLPEKFCLHDGEICWGKLADDVDVLFETEDGIPLVFSREYGQGLCINLNSGECKERISKSLMKPEKEFVDLLREAIMMQPNYEI